MWLPARNWHLAVNFVAFQTAWFAVVIGAANDWVWRGIAVAVLAASLHLWMSPRPQRELQLMLCVMLLGTVWDSGVASVGVIHYSSGQFNTHIAPLWIIAMWMLFATTLNVSLLFLRRNYWLAAAFGAVGAPLSFAAGMRLHALQFPNMPLAMGVLAAGWGVIMPLLIYLATHFDGMTENRSMSSRRAL